MDQLVTTGGGAPPRPLDLDSARALAAGDGPYGIVDIGSNSVRLVVYERMARAPLPRFNEKSLCRLGEGLAQTGAIHPDNFRRTVEAVRRFRAIADAMGVARLDATATEAMRRATNGPDLQRAITAETGLRIRILSGAEEARHAALGVISGFFRPVGLVGDMGGGSLEVAEALDDRVGERWVSLPLGALPVEALLEKGPDAAKRAVDALLADGLPPALTRPVFFPVGGGWRAIAKAHMAQAGAPVPVVHGYTVDTAAIRAFAKTLWRPAKPGAPPAGVPARRARTLPAAALVLDRTLKRLAPEKVVFSALGLREGWLYAQLPEAERRRDPLVEGAALIGLPAARVPRFAATLVPWTAELFPGETEAETRLRVAACALSDMGWRDHPDLRAAEMFRRVLQFPFIGIEHPERAFVASALHARYNGKADDPALLPAADLLSRATRRRAAVLGKALTLAYRLSAGVPEVLEGSRLKVGTDRVTLEVGRLARVPDSEVVAERLAALASAIGVRRSEVVEV
ncbi:Ppx/GppA family phosphatase [Lichenibacterium minor]|uniref:Ppx/GppA family phosphatase n=1 Tax=Lichenibacterium minor TaxID=2316528 RepID=A0A4Q2U088_9HYPH|nr:Ppx/GppA phosphatase family protein [Lichenibacterium minor]RYC29038.1 Ppx/GppA family phosphatase [Lichenibacterium minor]